MLRIYENTEFHKFTKKDDILYGVNIEYSKAYDLGDMLFKTLSSTPGHVSQIDGESGKTTTFAEMKDRSVRCALWLREMKIGSSDVIAYCTNNHLDTYIPIFSTFYVGAIYNAWYHKVDLRSAQRLMSLLRPKVIFAIEDAVGILTEAARLENIVIKIIVFGQNSRWPSIEEIMRRYTDKEVCEFQPVRIENPRQTAVILLTSGSTGFPKGVVHSYENIIKLFQSAFPNPLGNTMICFSTPYWISGLLCIHQCVLAHGTRIIMTEFEAERCCQLIEKYKIIRSFIVPFMAIEMQFYIKKYNCESLSEIFTGGAKLHASVQKKLKDMLPNTQVLSAYGLSEVGICASQTDKAKFTGSVGFVAANVQMKIIDVETGKTMGANQKGEICVKSETMMMGYYNEEMTPQVIDSEGWMHTGDLGYYEANGEIFVEHRLKELKKVCQVMVSPVEIEENLMSHPDVMEVAVVFVPHLKDINHPMAFVKKIPGAEVTKQELIDLSATLGKFKTLRAGVEFVVEIPKNPAGKVDRISITERALKMNEKL